MIGAFECWKPGRVEERVGGGTYINGGVSLKGIKECCQDVGVIRTVLRTGVQLETEPRHTGRLVHKNMNCTACGKN